MSNGAAAGSASWAEASVASAPAAPPQAPPIDASGVMVAVGGIGKYDAESSISVRFPGIPEGILLLNKCFETYGAFELNV